MIDVLVPVLGRPQNAQPLVDSLAASTDGARLTFVCSYEDDDQIRACEATGANVLFLARDPGPGDYARKINLGFLYTHREFVFNGADDIDFTPNWDDAVLREMRPNIAVVATNDMANREVRRGVFGTHNLIRRTYIEERGGTREGTPGVVMHEGYDHSYVDRELCDVAQQRGVYAFAKRSVVRHRHPLWRTAPWDDTYRRAVSKAREDQALYDTRKRDIVVR